MRIFVCCSLLLSFSILCSCDSWIELKNRGENVNDRVLECLETLIGVTDWPVHNFLVIYNETAVLDDDFFKRYPNFVWILYSTGNDKKLTGFFNVILFAENFHNLNETLRAISIRGIDGRAKFVIGVMEDFASLDDIRKASTGITAAMWKFDKTRVVYLVPCKGDLLLMTYFPFAKNCQVGELEVLDTWRGKDFENGVELFPEKMLDIRGCVQIHSVIFDKGFRLQVHKEVTENGEMMLGGIGGKLMTIVAERMNMDLHLSPEEPESWSVLINQILSGESLFSIGGNIPRAEQVEYFDLESEYLEESFGFGYLTDGFDVSWKNFVWPLSDKVWGYIGCIFPLFCGLIYAVNQYFRWQITPDKLTILDSLAIFLGNARVLPQSYFGRYLFGLWMTYSYLINATYNSELVSFLTTPNEKRVINTLEDLVENGIEFGGGTWHRNFYHDPLDPVMMKIHNNFKIWSDDESERCLTNGQCATGAVSSYLHTYKGEADHQLRMLTEKAFTFHVPVSMRRGSPFTIGVHRYTSQAVQNGLVNYWLRYYTRIPHSGGIGSKGPTVISTRHLRGILYLYIAGMICSSLAFIGELIFHKYFSNRRCH